ncbi:unnamed protein product [Schistosoma turkestanicum]|nr:unnamed protein product [Schistosoma turkestanicum]
MIAHQSQNILDELIKDFGWTHEFLSHPVEYEKCSYSQNHWVPVKSLTKHNNFCSLRQQGFVKEEIDAMIPNANVCIAESTQPTSDWTNDPSWITNMQAFSTDKSYRSSNSSSQDVSKLEALSMMRDAKRRRQSYRGIHTARKSYTEILREIIARQTEILSTNQESLEHQSEDQRRSSSVESFSSKTENTNQRNHYSHKYKTMNASRIRHSSPSCYPSRSSRSPSTSTTTTRHHRRNNETSKEASKSFFKDKSHHHHHHSSRSNKRQRSASRSPSTSSRHVTSSSTANKSRHHDHHVDDIRGDDDHHSNNNNLDIPEESSQHKTSKKHKKHSKHKHKHKSKK